MTNSYEIVGKNDISFLFLLYRQQNLIVYLLRSYYFYLEWGLVEI